MQRPSQRNRTDTEGCVKPWSTQPGESNLGRDILILELTKKCYYGCPWRIQQRTERETYHLPRENWYKKIQSVSALQKIILLHAIRIITCVVEWTTSLFISILLCNINVCRFVCIYLIFDNFIFILLLSDINLKNLVKGVWLCPSLYDMCKHQTSVSEERKKKDICISLKRTNKKKKRKERE